MSQKVINISNNVLSKKLSYLQKTTGSLWHRPPFQTLYICDHIIVSKPKKWLIIITDAMCFIMMTKCLSALPYGRTQQEAVKSTLQINASLC